MNYFNEILGKFSPNLLTLCSEHCRCYNIPFKQNEKDYIATIVNESCGGCLGEFITTQFIIPCDYFEISPEIENEFELFFEKYVNDFEFFKEKYENDFLSRENFKKLIENNLKIDNNSELVYDCYAFDFDRKVNPSIHYYSGFNIIFRIQIKGEQKCIREINLAFIRAGPENILSFPYSKKDEFFEQVKSTFSLKFSSKQIEQIISKLLIYISQFKIEFSICDISMTKHYGFIIKYFNEFLVKNQELTSIRTYVIPFNDPNHEELVNLKEEWKMNYDDYYPGLLENKSEVNFIINLFKKINDKIDLKTLEVSFFKNKRFEKDGINFTFSNENLFIYSGFLFKFSSHENKEEFHFYFVQDDYIPKCDSYYWYYNKNYDYFKDLF